MSENDIKKLGVRLTITQETDKFSHNLFEVFNVREFKNKSNFLDVLFELKHQFIKLIKSIEKE